MGSRIMLRSQQFPVNLSLSACFRAHGQKTLRSKSLSEFFLQKFFFNDKNRCGSQQIGLGKERCLKSFLISFAFVTSVYNEVYRVASVNACFCVNLIYWSRKLSEAFLVISKLSGRKTFEMLPLRHFPSSGTAIKSTFQQH